MTDGVPSKTPVAYLGPPSSYTHQAAADSFENSIYQLEYQKSIRDVFAAVQSSSAAFGVVPFENSSNGSVLLTLDLLIDRDKDFPDIYVCGEAYVDVQHCLLGHLSPSLSFENKELRSPHSSGSATPTINKPFPRQPRSKPLINLQHVKRVFSHPQAFGQCEEFLSTYLKGVEQFEVSSTSEAARLVADNHTKPAKNDNPLSTDACISSRLAADVMNLTILAQSIQDVEKNTTRFLVIQKGHVNFDDQGLIPERFQSKAAAGKNRKALVSFNIDHKTQGALANALTIFKNHGFNLTSINSRPSRIRPWHYNFLVEFEGTKELEDPDLLHSALNDLDTATEWNKWLGCWMDRFE